MSTAPRTSRFISNAAICPAPCARRPQQLHQVRCGCYWGMVRLTALPTTEPPFNLHPAMQEARSPSGLGGGPPLPQYVRFWHKADMLNELTICPLLGAKRTSLKPSADDR